MVTKKHKHIITAQYKNNNKTIKHHDKTPQQ